MAHLQNEVTWTLHNEQRETVTLSFHPRLLSNDFTPIYQAIIAGVRIGLLPEFLFPQELHSGNIVNVLSQWSLAPVPIKALIWLPAILKIFALTGGALKTPAGEITGSSMMLMLRSLTSDSLGFLIEQSKVAEDIAPPQQQLEMRQIRHEWQI